MYELIVLINLLTIQTPSIVTKALENIVGMELSHIAFLMTRSMRLGSVCAVADVVPQADTMICHG
jgi:hypothetical protein